MNTENITNQVVAEYDQHEKAEKAVKLLGDAHIKMSDISMLGRDYQTEEQPLGYVNTGDRMLTWGKFGAFWGSIWGILFGSAVIVVPGVGALLFAGWFVTAVLGALEGAVVGGGIAALGAAFASIGIPDDTVLAYQTSITAGNFLVIVRATSDEIGRATEILDSLTPKTLSVSDYRVLSKV